ncbi:hypothetical protein C8J57DRAFT_1594800 [Mycena rebaudengoi]|nr:hypothetical protein C8J57DRAFT_1594800 [Mycena rebaudengoi]
MERERWGQQTGKKQRKRGRKKRTEETTAKQEKGKEGGWQGREQWERKKIQQEVKERGLGPVWLRLPRPGICQEHLRWVYLAYTRTASGGLSIANISDAWVDYQSVKFCHDNGDKSLSIVGILFMLIIGSKREYLEIRCLFQHLKSWRRAIAQIERCYLIPGQLGLGRAAARKRHFPKLGCLTNERGDVKFRLVAPHFECLQSGIWKRVLT